MATFDRRTIIAIGKKYMDIFQQTRKTSKTIIFHLLEKDNKIT